MRLLLGTKNSGKITEIQKILASVSCLKLVTFCEQPFSDVVETGATFKENARKKAHQISQETGLPVLAEDSGLEVDALDGWPGIHSARFAGNRTSKGERDRANIEKLLYLLKGVADRRACFRCITVLVLPSEQEFISEGELRGGIAQESRGLAGFGYDSIFIPNGYEQTLAELGDTIKNQISHRRRALEGMKDCLQSLR